MNVEQKDHGATHGNKFAEEIVHGILEPGVEFVDHEAGNLADLSLNVVAPIADFFTNGEGSKGGGSGQASGGDHPKPTAH